MNEKFWALLILAIICIFVILAWGINGETIVGTAVGAIAGFITGSVTK